MYVRLLGPPFEYLQQRILGVSLHCRMFRKKNGERKDNETLDNISELNSKIDEIHSGC